MSSPLETLRALSRSTRPQYERNENEITPPRNEELPLNPPDEGLNSFNSFLSLPGNADDLDERAAIIAEGTGVPRRWAEGFAALCAMPAPTGFSPQRWQRVIDATGIFIDRWAAKAIHCGWSDLDVFGCNPDAPDRRFDCMGLALLLDRCTIIDIDEAGATIETTGARQRYRRRRLPPGTVSLWELTRAG
jgi:hypothetical protein